MAEITADMVIEKANELIISIAGFNNAFSVSFESAKEVIETLPFWDSYLGGTGILFPTIDRNGTISGTVKVQGVLQNKARVSLYFRKTGALIQSTFTDANGAARESFLRTTGNFRFLFRCKNHRRKQHRYDGNRRSVVRRDCRCGPKSFRNSWF